MNVFVLCLILAALNIFTTQPLSCMHAAEDVVGLDIVVIAMDKVKPETDREYTDCSICIEDLKEGETIISVPCSAKHKFHKACIDRWLEKEPPTTCPNCREVLPVALHKKCSQALKEYLVPVGCTVCICGYFAYCLLRCLNHLFSDL